MFLPHTLMCCGAPRWRTTGVRWDECRGTPCNEAMFLTRDDSSRRTPQRVHDGSRGLTVITTIVVRSLSFHLLAYGSLLRAYPRTV